MRIAWMTIKRYKEKVVFRKQFLKMFEYVYIEISGGHLIVTGYAIGSNNIRVI